MKRTLLIFTFLLCLTVSQAQKSDVGNWVVFNLQTNFTKRINLLSDFNIRNYYLFNDLEKGLIRTTINYHLVPNQIIAGAGAAFVHNEAYSAGSDSKRISEERRLHQQIQFRHTAGPLFITHRYRFEERFFSHRNRLRFRYQLSIQAPLNKKEMTKGAVYTTFMNEVMLHTTAPIYDRNRIALGAGYVINNHLRLDISMMWQILETSRRPQTLLTISKTLDFTSEN